MKVLYISHSREESGYGRYCRDFLKALKTTDLDIASIAIPLGKATSFKDETENNYISSPDLIIQNILPHLISKGRIKTVGTAILESADVKYNYWHQHLQMLDQVIYPHYPLGIFDNEIEIPTAIDISPTKNIPRMEIDEINGTYKFYWIGELTKRKNLSGLIKSYLNAFCYSDPVSLIIKAHCSNFDKDQAKHQIHETIYTITNGMKLYRNPKDYPRIVVLTDFFPEDQILGLHNYCDCFVSSSHGESICYPMLDALKLNKNILSSQTFATESYSKYGKIHISFSDNKTRCFGQVDTFDFYQTSLEKYNDFNQDDFERQMKSIYENRPEQKNDVSDLSYVNIGKKIKELL
jgi:glycosyltransferase involved in cell wall biosynthesis